MKGLVITIEIVGEYVACAVSVFDGDFKALQEAVGGYVEAVPTHDRVSMWCNEDGKGQGLLRNLMAEHAWRMYDSFGLLAAGDWLAGDIVVLGPRNTSDDGPLCQDLPHDERILTIAACIAWPGLR